MTDKIDEIQEFIDKEIKKNIFESYNAKLINRN